MDDQSEVIQDETRPIEVRFSISDDPNDVYDWQTPDFMTESLFADDFLIEIVETVRDRDTQTFIQLLDPFSALWDELRRWNQKHDKWYDGHKICSQVRETCSNEKSIGDFISLCPSQGNIRRLNVQINNEIDPFGELRIEINQLKASREPEVLEETGDDKYPSDDEEEAIDQEVQANPEKPNCYYPSQEKMAAILKKRIDKIMSHYHRISRLSDAFNDVEFAVYTARYKMLCDQTEKRIHHPNAGVLSKEELESRDDGSGKKRMFMYVHSKVTEDHFEQLRRKVQDKPKTLFVIIADECHWGITKDKDDKKSSAHNLFINEWCKGTPRNVVVIQISATPFNLLTKNSRLPEVRCEAGNLVVLKGESNLQHHPCNNSKEVELHVVHWSELELKNFETGIRMKLKSALNIKDAPHQYLHVSSDGKLTTVEDDATDFIVQGTNGIVTLQALASKEQETKLLTVSRDARGNLEAKVDPKQPTTFQVKLDFGVGVVAFCSCENPDHYLAVNKLGNVTLEAAAVERKWGVSIMKPKAKVTTVSFQFYTKVVEVDMAGPQYMSLNYYLSTINCSNKSDQKIREDESFQKIAKKAKKQKRMTRTDSSYFPIDALLCAEYCYHILHVSVYHSNKKIRQALTSPADGSPAAEFDRRLKSFLCKLEEGPKKSTIEYIHPEAFKLVREQLCDEAANDFKENVKKVAKLLKSKSSKEIQGENEVLATSFVACLMHLSQQEMQQIKKETHSYNIDIGNITQMLKENDCQEMVETWNCIVEDSETLSLVKSLIQSGKGKLGKMKIVRAKNTKNANQFYHTLQLARKESSLENCFEIIRDYGEIQIEKQLMKPSSPFFQKLQPDICMYKSDCSCSERKQQLGCQKCANCQHVHKLITQYEDLENLACVLILVEKGRMGDTFPHSFDCLDLRLSYDSSREYLSTLIQELGRICRYVKVSVHEHHVDHTPYVLVGQELFKKLKESLERNPSMCAVNCNSVDRYMTPAKIGRSKDTTSFPLRWLNYEAQKDSYDHQNQEKHCNRILLQAEPQIGKTGSYLCLIKYLRQDILGMEKDSSKSPTAFDEGTLYCHKECHPSTIYVVNDKEGTHDWKYPYWKTIEDSPSLSVKPVAPGKYSIGGCFYTHDTEEFPYHLMKSGQSNPSKSTHHLQKEDCIDNMRAWHWYHFKTCAECRICLQGKESVLGTLEVNIDGKPVIVNYSLPSNHPSYNHLLEQLQSTKSTEEAFSGINWAAAVGNAPSLAYWIFHPSHRDDPRKCTFNYHHVMQENDQVASHVQVAVVRSEKFDEYRTFWGKVLAIFQLPEKLPTGNCEHGPSDGGVGYARLFIQKMAFALNLEYVFMIDDNVAVMKEAAFTTDHETAFDKKVSRDENGVMRMERCSFFKPLNHLQKIVQGKDIPSRGEETYESHPLKEQFEAHQLPLYSYTGPAKLFGDKQLNSYGVLGLLRSVPTTVNPFSKTQVYAAILLNVKSTVEKDVFYRPWPFWEDLRFNDDCDKAGLWVVKCNRYHFLKVQYNDGIQKLIPPSIFEWKDDTILEKRPKASKLHREEEEGIILEQLRNFVNSHGTEKCFKGTIGYDQQEGKLSPASRVVDQLEVREGTKEAFASGIPVLILSYCAIHKHENINLLFSRFF